MSSVERYCYCQVDETEAYMLSCDICKGQYHPGCLKTGRPSPLLGDTFFKFVCETCSSTGDEVCERLKLQWTQVLLLSLYNLQFDGSGKCGFFRWREHICSFVDRHWVTFFGSKKKTNTWHGTVAGTLSGGCPHFFKSGTPDLGEAGWWALAIKKIPGPEEFENQSAAKVTRKQKQQQPVEQILPVEGLRHRTHKNAIQAAMELKEKRSTVQEAKDIRRIQQKLPDIEGSGARVERSFMAKNEPSCSNRPTAVAALPEISNTSSIDSSDLPVDVCFVVKPEQNEDVPCPRDMLLQMDFEIAKQEELTALEFDLDSNKLSPDFQLGSPPIAELLSTLSTDTFVDVTPEDNIEISKLMEDENEESSPSSTCSVSKMNFPEEEEEEPTEQSQLASVCRKRKIKQEEVKDESQESKCTLMSLYDEHELLKKLEKLSDVVDKHPVARQLRRKLLVRQKQRELNLPVFDIDSFMKTVTVEHAQIASQQEFSLGSAYLDRYMMAGYNLSVRSHLNFLTRLMGLEEEQLESTTSPYTLRSLKPFIFRDYETLPLKLKLLLEISAYPYRDDPEWKPPPRYPIDYCYVRPHHIPAANALCQEFFWPGIDLSECLQYPDFSCVAVYRKVVVGFAFMVPDVSYNEAYISFIFTHPEWRNAGIATFMLYHLIQTCMGKDVTLHVSATNPACFLYQKFGFKVEELIIDFYNKYLPANSKDCKNALFLRLSR